MADEKHVTANVPQAPPCPFDHSSTPMVNTCVDQGCRLLLCVFYVYNGFTQNLLLLLLFSILTLKTFFSLMLT